MFGRGQSDRWEDQCRDGMRDVFGWRTDQLTSHSADSMATMQPITDQYMSHRSISASFAGR